MGENYYSLLQIPNSATQRDIKVAYRKLVQTHHPDVNISADDELIKFINIAYETLSDPIKKEKYDRSLLGGYKYSSPTQSYTNSTYRRPRRPPPPDRYRHRFDTQSSGNYTFTLRTKIIGWSVTILGIMLVTVAIWALHYYSSAYYYEEGVAAEKNNEIEKALNFYQLAIRDWGDKSVEASIKSAEISQQRGAYYFVIENCIRGFSYDPDSLQSARLFYLEGSAFYQSEDYKKAEQAYLNSLKFNFNKDTIYHQLGWIYINHLDEYKKAEKIYSYLLASNTFNLADYYNRGICYQYLGEHQKAIDDFLIILNDNPYHGKTLFQLGRSHLALGQKEKACYYLRFSENQSINIDPEDLAKACN